MGRGKSFREPRRRGFDDDDFSYSRDRGPGGPTPSFTPPRPAVSAGPIVGATVKWFNPEKGFGFVSVEDGSGDAFLHAAVLERSGHGAVQPGATLQIRVERGQKGPQVSEVLEVDSSTVSREPSRAPGQGGPASASRAPAGPTTQVDGTVKWFNPDKGFGFIAAEGGGKDVFVHASALQRSGLMTLAEGQRVKMDVRQGQKGPEVATLRLDD